MTSTFTDDRLELLAAINLTALFEELVGPRGRGGGWPCPNRDHAQTGASPPVSIDRERGLWHCWGCDAAGSAVDVLRLARGLDTADAFAELRRRAGRPSPRPTSSPSRAPRCDPAPDGRPMPAEAAERTLSRFCSARGWRREVTDRYGLEAIVDRWGRPRIRFPFRSGGELRWWQDRATNATPPKWLAPAGRRPILYALDLAATLDCARSAGVLVIAEGPADAVALAHLDGLAELTVALPGKAVPTAQVAAIAAATLGSTGVAVVATDADQAGDRLRDELTAALVARGVPTATARPPAGLDLDDWRRQVGDGRLRHVLLEAIADAPTSPEVEL